jgi:hypothetical protein
MAAADQARLPIDDDGLEQADRRETQHPICPMTVGRCFTEARTLGA